MYVKKNVWICCTQQKQRARKTNLATGFSGSLPRNRLLVVTQRSVLLGERCVTSKKTAAKETTSQVNQPFCNKNLTDYITTVETIVSFLSRVVLSAHLLLCYND